MSARPFMPIEIRNLKIENRFVMSAAVDGMSGDLEGRIQRYVKLAQGGVGLIIAGRVLGKNESFGKIVEAVHKADGKIAIQILSRKGLGFDPKNDLPAAGVVPKESPIFNIVCPYGPHHEADENEIAEMINDYASAAKLAKEFGVDAVQVHSAHNSALFQYLTPLINKRSDKWGGDISNRVRIHKEVYNVVRAEVGEKMPVLIKLGVEDPFPNGLKFEDGKKAACLLAEHGYDALEISQGLQDFSNAKTWYGTPMRMNTVKISDEAYFRSWCGEIKKVIKKPTIMTGGIRSFELAEEMLSRGETDLIGMCRPFIKEPGLIKRWQDGDHRKATCISCNKCGMALTKNLPLACYVKEKWNF